jgi:hypothetical protein
MTTNSRQPLFCQWGLDEGTIHSCFEFAWTSDHHLDILFFAERSFVAIALKQSLQIFSCLSVKAICVEINVNQMVSCATLTRVKPSFGCLACSKIAIFICWTLVQLNPNSHDLRLLFHSKFVPLLIDIQTFSKSLFNFYSSTIKNLLTTQKYMFNQTKIHQFYSRLSHFPNLATTFH